MMSDTATQDHKEILGIIWQQMVNDRRMQEADAILAAITAWNTRTPDPRVMKLVEAARGMLDAYYALLCMKAEDPTRFTEPGSKYDALKHALSAFNGDGK